MQEMPDERFPMSTEEFWRGRQATRMQALIPDRVYAWRDRLISNPRFQRWAARFPLTRGVAQGQARMAFDLCAGFVYAQVLFACVQLNLFDRLKAGPLTLDVIAAETGLKPEAAMRLLNAACALGLVSRRPGDRFGLGMQGAAIAGNPSIAMMVQHHAMLYRDLEDPVALLKGEATTRALANYWPYATTQSPSALAPREIEGYSRLMSASQEFIAGDVIEAYPFARHKVLLDVGGGEGTFLTAVAARAPSLHLKLFDLPAVAARAEQKFHATGLNNRAVAIGGSFRTDPLPTGADAISLVRIVHDHDDAVVMDLLRAIRAALAPDGVLLIAEPFAGVRGAEAIGDAYFGFYLLAMGSGRARTPAELKRMLHAAGFKRVQQKATARPMLTGLLVAHAK
jgi:demethylspheroidene O-methyltransferase